ncbi:MAG: hypothetical protein ABFR75_14765 [Acidobacteriota bacterium]
MKKTLIIVLVLIIPVMVVYSGQAQFRVKQQVKPNLILQDKYIYGLVFDDGVSTGIQNKYVGIFINKCKRVYVSLADNVLGGLTRFPHPFTKVRIKISAGAYLMLSQAYSPHKKIPGLEIKVVRNHKFAGRVTVMNCNDRYIEISYRLCNYGTFPVRIYFPSDYLCKRYRLKVGDRVRVVTSDWTYDPASNTTFFVNSFKKITKY